MKPQFIYLIRHGESEGNVDNSVYAHTPDWKINLTKRGEEQATEAGIKLAKDLAASWIGSPDRGKLLIYTSPWYRTRQTAKLINRSFNVEIREDPRIREQEWGNYAEEHSKLKIERERKEFGTFFYRMPCGESGADVYDRISTFIGSLHRDFEKETFPLAIAIVSHGLTIKTFLMRWFKWSVEDFDLIKTPENCSLIKMAMNLETHKYTLVTALKKRKYPTEPKSA